MKDPRTYAAALQETNPREVAAALQDALFEQEAETTRDRDSKGHISTSSLGVDEVEPPETLDDEYQLYEETGFISASLEQYGRDVIDPGYRVVADSEETEEWFNEEFLPQAGVFGGQRHQDFGTILKNDVVQYMAYGNLLNENVKNGEGQITGFLPVDPASCKAITEPDKPILVSPDATKKEWFDGETTPRDEAAAFVQFHPESILGRKGLFDEDRETNPLSLNDVTYRPRSPAPGDIWGTPITRNIKDELTEFKQMRKDLAHAVQTKAWGIWSVAFNTEVIETDDRSYIEEWDEAEMDEFVEGVGEMGPGELVGHDGSIEFDKFQGEVPEEVLDVLEAYVKLIVAALPTPLYAVGFEDNINQFVVKQQETIYDAHVRGMQRILEETWTPTMKQVAEDHGKDSSGLEFKVEPGDEDSPILSMEIDDLEKFALYAEGLGNLFGEDAYRAFDPELFGELVALLPEEAFKTEAFVGVPGGPAPEIEELPILDEAEKGGKVSLTQLEQLQARLQAMKRPADAPSVSMPNPFFENQGGTRELFGSDEDEEEEREAVRGQGGQFQGSE